MFRLFVLTIAFMVYGCEGRWLYGFDTDLDVSVPTAKVIPVSLVLKEPMPRVPKLVNYTFRYILLYSGHLS